MKPTGPYVPYEKFMMTPDTAERGSCVGDPEFVAMPTTIGEIDRDRRICAGCVIQTECAIESLALGQKDAAFSGGMTYKERRTVRAELGVSRLLSDIAAQTDQPQPQTSYIPLGTIIR